MLISKHIKETWPNYTTFPEIEMLRTFWIIKNITLQNFCAVTVYPGESQNQKRKASSTVPRKFPVPISPRKFLLES